MGAAELDGTRGPDTQLPVWVDQLKQIDFKKMAALFPDSLPSKPVDTPKVKRKSPYTYLSPNNPVIPLSKEKQQVDTPGYFPVNAKSPKKPVYFPGQQSAGVPIVKFAPPLYPLQPPSEPVQPPRAARPPLPGPGPAFSPPSQADQASFQPVFIQSRPDSNSPGPAAFPGIAATIRAGGETGLVTTTPPGPQYEEYSYADPTQYYDTDSPYAAVPEYAGEYPEYPAQYPALPSDLLLHRTTSRPAVTTKKPVTSTQYDPRRRTKQQQQQQQAELVQSLLAGNTVPQLEIEEVTTTSTSTTSTAGTNPSQPELELDILHKGSPRQEETTVVQDAAESTEGPQYEYEYVYEYYDDYEQSGPGVTDLSSAAASTERAEAPRTSLGAILSFLNAEESTLAAQQPLATPGPAIRSSTLMYDTAAYPELQRSTVTVEVEDRWGRASLPERGPTARSSSPYPFHPDRLDPASQPDNSVNWYYSSYSDQNTDPYIGPRPAGSATSRPCLATLLVTVALLLGRWV